MKRLVVVLVLLGCASKPPPPKVCETHPPPPEKKGMKIGLCPIEWVDAGVRLDAATDSPAEGG